MIKIHYVTIIIFFLWWVSIFLCQCAICCQPTFPVVGTSPIGACVSSSSAFAKNRGSSRSKPKGSHCWSKAPIETSRQPVQALLQQRNSVPSPSPMQIDLLNYIPVACTTAQTLPKQKVRNSRGSLSSAACNQLNRMTKAAPASASSSTITSLSSSLSLLSGYAKTTCVCQSYLILKRPQFQYFLISHRESLWLLI